MLEDALMIQGLLAKGKRPAEIQQALGLNKTGYYRRYAVLIDLVKEDFDFDKIWAAFIRYQARLEGVAGHAREIVETLMPGIGETTEIQNADGDKRKKAVKARRPEAVVSALKVIVECEDKILHRAMDLGIVNRVPQEHKIGLTLEDVLKEVIEKEDASND